MGGRHGDDEGEHVVDEGVEGLRAGRAVRPESPGHAVTSGRLPPSDLRATKVGKSRGAWAHGDPGTDAMARRPTRPPQTAWRSTTWEPGVMEPACMECPRTSKAEGSFDLPPPPTQHALVHGYWRVTRCQPLHMARPRHTQTALGSPGLDHWTHRLVDREQHPRHRPGVKGVHPP